MASGERAGFLIGDGAGVGKGRTIAGIMLENFLQGRKKSIWVCIEKKNYFNLIGKVSLWKMMKIGRCKNFILAPVRARFNL